MCHLEAIHPMIRANTRPQATEFANGLEKHMMAWRRALTGHRGKRWRYWTDGVYGDYRGLAESSVVFDSVSLHSEIRHLRSSQAFAFNLFLPFREGKKVGLSERISELANRNLTVDRLTFEWVPAGGLLGELRGEQPLDHEPATAVDVVLWSHLETGRRAVVLLEVKLSEGNFSHCKGRFSRGNRRQDVCQSARLIL